MKQLHLLPCVYRFVRVLWLLVLLIRTTNAAGFIAHKKNNNNNNNNIQPIRATPERLMTTYVHCRDQQQRSAQTTGTVTTTTSPLPRRSNTRLFSSNKSDKLNRDIEERSYRRAQGEGAGEMAAGAILGGLVLGPFGKYVFVRFV